MLCGRNMNQGREAERALTAAAHYHNHYCYRGLLGEIPPSRENVPVYHTVQWIRSRTQRCKAITCRLSHTHKMNENVLFCTHTHKFLCVRSRSNTHMDACTHRHTASSPTLIMYTLTHQQSVFLVSWYYSTSTPTSPCFPHTHTHMFLQSRLTHACFTSFCPIRQSSTSPLNWKLFSFTWSFSHHYIKVKHAFIIKLFTHICSFIV